LVVGNAMTLQDFNGYLVVESPSCLMSLFSMPHFWHPLWHPLLMK
jgi:hypothetical protein